jgi:hypothetical protein
MTERKLNTEDDLWFETTALRELKRLSTDTWGDMLALWGQLSKVAPAAQRRILACCVELASKRGDPLPAIVAKHVIRALDPKTSRASVLHDHDRAQDGFRKLAHHLARNPRASLSELAAAAGSKKTTVRLWKARPDFQAYLNDEEVFVRGEREWLARLGRERREHILRRWAARRRRWAARRAKKRSPKKGLMNG